MRPSDPTDIRAQEEAAAVQAERQALTREIDIGDLRWVMSDKRGRRFVQRLLSQAGMERSSFDTNAASMAFKEGFRWAGILLDSELRAHCWDRYVEMQSEARQ